MDLQPRKLSDDVQCPVSPKFDDLGICKGEHVGCLQQECVDIVDAFNCARVANHNLWVLYDKIHHHHTRS